MKISRLSFRNIATGAILCGTIFLSQTALSAGHRHHGEMPALYKEMLEQSMADKSGLTFFLNGQTLPAVVTKINDDGTIEGRSQQYGRIAIHLHKVNAIAKQ